MALIDCPECGKQISSKAITCPNCAYPISKEMARRYFNVGNEQLDKNNFSLALEQFDTALSLDNKFVAVYKSRGLANLYSNRNKEAIIDFTAYLATNPKDIDIINRLAQARIYIQDYKGAAAEYSKVIEIETQNSYAYYQRGLMKVEILDFKGAISDFTNAIEANPFDNCTYYWYFSRAEAKMKIKNYNGAVNDFSKSLAVGDPKSIGPSVLLYKELGNAQKMAEEYESAIDTLDNAIKIIEDTWKEKYQLVKLSPDDFNKLDSHFRAIQQLASDCFEIRGFCRYKLRDFSRSRQDFENAKAYNPFNLSATIHLVKIKYLLKD